MAQFDAMLFAKGVSVSLQSAGVTGISEQSNLKIQKRSAQHALDNKNPSARRGKGTRDKRQIGRIRVCVESDQAVNEG